MTDWDERFGRGEHVSTQPHALLERAIEGRSQGRALDLACGAGRHALYLATRGWQVVAVDVSRAGIELTRERAASNGVEIDVRHADLACGEFVIEPETYDLVCDFYYLQRDLFADARRGLRDGGMFVAAILLAGGDASQARPVNPTFVLQPGELHELFKEWKIEHYFEAPERSDQPGQHSWRTAEIIAVKTKSDERASLFSNHRPRNRNQNSDSCMT